MLAGRLSAGWIGSLFGLGQHNLLVYPLLGSHHLALPQREEYLLFQPGKLAHLLNQ